ncbi:MAG TPA: cupin domain-containing protein [Alphaproteobacteria bacterium]|nr:cupin domain-containing protein [Alphaproteobacteria bacterium]
MDINADFTRRAAVHAATLDWVPSPMPGVKRKMLDRIGGEVARATSIVRYDPGSSFSPHVHGGGEEFLVLEGVFQDEAGDFPAGTYVRNPPQSRHTPGSTPGCVLFVKLWQFDPNDRKSLRIDSGHAHLTPASAHFGVSDAILHEDERETVRVERWNAGSHISRPAEGGLEILCLEGGFIEAGEPFRTQSWLRLPVGARLDALTGPEGCRLWIKEGHLRFAEAQRAIAPAHTPSTVAKAPGRTVG